MAETSTANRLDGLEYGEYRGGMSVFFSSLFLSSNDWHIVCDFDGTVTPFDVTDALLTRFAPPEWEVVEQQWVENRITARQCMAEQIAMLRAEQDEMDAFLDTIPLTDGFVDFLREAAVYSLPVSIVSDGLDYAIRRILALRSLPPVPVTANALRRAHGAYTLDFPYGKPACPSGVCKCAVVNGLQAKGTRVLLIGDGLSDCCAARQADAVLARKGKALHALCKEASLPYAVFENFHDVICLPLPAGTETASPPHRQPHAAPPIWAAQPSAV